MSPRPSTRAASIERTLIRRLFDAAPPDAINLGLGQPDLPTPSSVALAGAAAIADGRTGYTTTAGVPALREAIAERYGGFAAGADDVVVTCGSQEALVAACFALGDPGQSLLYPDPGYPAYPTVARLAGLEPRAYPLRAEAGFRPRPADIEPLLDERTAAVLMCTPSNPTGACHRDDELDALLELLAAREIPWISDEIYDGFVWRDPAPAMPWARSREGIVVSGLSKTMSMTGWRIGWLVSETALAARCVAIHQHLTTCAPAPSQAAALATFTPAGRSAGRAIVERFARRRELALATLREVTDLDVRTPDGGFYLWVDVRGCGESSLELARRLAERRGVVVIPGEAFGERGPGWLRISFACDEARLVEGLRRIGDELRAV